MNRSDPARSLIFGTNKVKAPTGALVAFGLDGAIRQVFAGLMVAMNSAPKSSCCTAGTRSPKPAGPR